MHLIKLSRAHALNDIKSWIKYAHILKPYSVRGSKPNDQNRVVTTLPNLLKFRPRNLITTRDTDPANHECPQLTTSKAFPFLAMSPTRQDLTLINSFQRIAIKFQCTNPYRCTITSLSKSLGSILKYLETIRKSPHDSSSWTPANQSKDTYYNWHITAVIHNNTPSTLTSNQS